MDVEIIVGNKSFGHSVDARVTVEMLQRIAGNGLQIILEGYWVPVVITGEGRVGRLQSGDKVLMQPATDEDIERIN